jgi:hypothetical protein
MMGFLMIPLVGTLALGFEVSNWYMTTRAMQNAADAAVVAAATNAGSNYDVEAKAVAAQYGFIDGTNTVSIVASNTAACPGGGNNCYSVTISGSVPLYLSQCGSWGTSRWNGSPKKLLSSVAVKSNPNTPMSLFTRLAAGYPTNGAPKARYELQHHVEHGSTLNGGNLCVPIGASHNTNNGCGITQYSNVPAVADTYAALAKNIPADTCGSYPQEPGKKGPALPKSNQLSGLQSWGGNVVLCGDIQLTANVTIDAPTNAVVVIENGQLTPLVIRSRPPRARTYRDFSGSTRRVHPRPDGRRHYLHRRADLGGVVGCRDLSRSKIDEWR